MSPLASGRPARVAVVGGGIAGLAAALRLREHLGHAAEITVVEQRDRLGGKLRTGTLAGQPVERGSDAFLLRDPGGGGESPAVALARRVGLGDALVHPAGVPAGLILDGAPHRVPGGTLFGIPADPAGVADVAPAPADADPDEGRPLLAAGSDTAVGELVRQRYGDAVVDRLVDPMLGGVYAGRADDLSLAVTMPALASACTTAHTLGAAVSAARAASPRPADSPVFAGVAGGMSRLVDETAAASAASVGLGLPVRALAPAGGGWRLVVGPTRAPQRLDVDAVVLALPARPAGRLLTEVAPEPAAEVATLDYASVALVTLALPQWTPPEWSGFLVPATEGAAVKAVTFVSRKWPDAARDSGTDSGTGPGTDAGTGADVTLVRASVGRYHDTGALQLADQALVEQTHTELARLLAGAAAPLPTPVTGMVQRWGGALPQYAPGHRLRVAAARSALPDTLRLAGAGYDGVGVPACVRSGETAADQVAAALGQSET